jgi:hypothetical protein
LLLPESDIQDKLSELRSNLFSVLSFWFNKSKREALVHKELLMSSVLDKDWNELPTHGQRLKIIKEVSRATSNEELIDRVLSTKRGLLGTFTQQQKGFGKSRTGRGVWQGNICGIMVMIEIQNNVCEAITVNSLHDTVSLGIHLNNFMNDASLEMPRFKKEEIPNTNSWLDSEGKILVTRLAKGVPIFQNSLLKGVQMDETVSMSWFVDCNNQNIRIRARNQRTNETFTIMSETLTNQDWISGIAPIDDDPVFRQWQMGDSVNMVTLENCLKKIFPRSRNDFNKAMTLIEKHKYKNLLDWDLKNFQLTTRDTFRIRLSAAKETDVEEDIKIQKDVLEKFQDMIADSFEDFDVDWDEELEFWGDEVDVEEAAQEELWGIKLDGEEERALEESIRMFTTAAPDKFFELLDYQDLTKNFRMPANNRFFSTIEHINMVMHGESFSDSISKSRTSEGLLGMVLSLVTGKFSIGKDEELSSEVIRLEQEWQSISSTISRPAAILALSLEEIRVNISNLLQQIEDAPKILVPKYRRLLGHYLDREEEILMRIDPSSKDMVMLNASLVINKLKRHFSEHKMIPFDLSVVNEEMADGLFKTFVRIEVSSNKTLTDQEKEETLLHLSTNSISRGSLQSIGIAFNFTIHVNEQLINKHSEDPEKVVKPPFNINLGTLED